MIIQGTERQYLVKAVDRDEMRLVRPGSDLSLHTLKHAQMGGPETSICNLDAGRSIGDPVAQDCSDVPAEGVNWR